MYPSAKALQTGPHFYVPGLCRQQLRNQMTEREEILT